MFSAGDAQDFASLSGLMNDKQDEERHDHKPGEQQRGGNAPEQACRCGGGWGRRPLWGERRGPKGRSRFVWRGGAPAGGGGPSVERKTGFSASVWDGRKKVFPD